MFARKVWAYLAWSSRNDRNKLDVRLGLPCSKPLATQVFEVRGFRS